VVAFFRLKLNDVRRDSPERRGSACELSFGSGFVMLTGGCDFFGLRGFSSSSARPPKKDPLLPNSFSPSPLTVFERL
jgi:hypothetical protein